MRQFDRKFGNTVFFTALLCGFALFMAGTFTQATLLAYIGIMLMAFSVGYRVSYFKCPSCHRHLPKDATARCPYCGKRLNKRAPIATTGKKRKR